MFSYYSNSLEVAARAIKNKKLQTIALATILEGIANASETVEQTGEAENFNYLVSGSIIAILSQGEQREEILWFLNPCLSVRSQRPASRKSGNLNLLERKS